MDNAQVTQEAREAAAKLIERTDAYRLSPMITAGDDDGHYIVQAFAKFERDTLARHRLERSEWMGIESAPKDGTPFLAAIYVRHNDEPRRWDIHVIGYDAAYDEMNSYFETGWEIEDYAFWMPLPKPPALSLAGGDL